ncbi:actin-like protein arp8 [Malassezia vespertilionis]|uniref:Arp8p n=1 Tax=Malassezia vespertilionis TaxID=2020962 RepID=A0A2N1JC66_9BASI|nr:actin-like protein arp8 [Malassezia vespertilionis]PKI84139.1 Arp8p [Malassezia vespertilionis]WFD06943.1 actin-like protein arp8 [Malassezia vespertilionis]
MPHQPKQVLRAAPPADPTRELPVCYTSFHPPSFINAKNVSSSYLKTEAQTWMARSGRPKHAKRKREGSAEGSEEEEELDASYRLVVHMGAEFLRVGRATDLFPTTVPSVLARRMQEAPVPEQHTDESCEVKIESLRNELRSIMRQYKLRPVSNGQQSVHSYNASVEPERVLEHNDVYHQGWVPNAPSGDAEVDGKHKTVLVGDEALRLACLSPKDAAADRHGWQLFYPWRRGMLDIARYTSTYGASAAVQALLGDLQTIVTYALSAPLREDGSESVASAGLGIPQQDFGRYSVLLLVPDSCSKSDLRALGSMLLMQMGFAALNVQTEGLCAIFGAGLSAACIVDLGATSIGISCVEEGLVLPETRVSLAYGGQDMSAFFGQVLAHAQFPYRAMNIHARLADAALLDTLKKQLVTLQPSQVGLNLTDFMVRLPATQTVKYALRYYDEPIVAGLMLFHPDVIAFYAETPPRRAANAASALPAVADEQEGAASLLASNASLGGDEAQELSAHAPSDIGASLAMLACVERSLPEQALAALSTLRTQSAQATQAAEVEEGTPEAGQPSPAPLAKQPAPPPAAAFSTLAQKCTAAATLAAQSGVDVVSASSRTPLDRAVFHSLLASTGTLDGQVQGAGADERLRRLANNIMCIGGTARVPGLGEALEARVSMRLVEHYTPTDPARTASVAVPPDFAAPQATVIPPPRNMEPEFLAWKGLAVLAHLDALQELWILRADWDKFGYRALKEKSLFL